MARVPFPMRFLSLFFRGVRWLLPVVLGSACWTGAPRLLAGTAPVIALQPQSTNLTIGQNAVLSVAADGTAPLSYQWALNGTNLLWATTPVITLTNASYLTVGLYSAVVTNAFGKATTASANIGLSAIPIITNGPTSTEVYFGREASFSVGVYSLTQVGYQWYFGSTVLTGQTNPVLHLTGVTNENAGSYYVFLTNAVGKTTSFSAQLKVDPWPAPAIRLGEPTIGTQQISFPVIYLANGAETNFSFSLRYDPAVLTNPQLLLTQVVAGTNVGVVVSSNAVGASVRLSTNVVIYPGETNLGTAQFSLLPGATNLFAGRIEFSDFPLPLLVEPPLSNYLTLTTNISVAYLPTNGHTVAVTNTVVVTNTFIAADDLPPVFTGVTAGPALNFRNGLIENLVEVANPGSRLLDNLFLLVAYNQTLATVAQTNPVTLYNATGRVIPSGWFINEGSIAPGERRTLLLQYNVSDRSVSHLTNPTPTLEIAGTAVVITNGPSGSLKIVGGTNPAARGLTLQFPSQTNFHYYIQYAPNAAALIDPARSQTVVPSFPGTGHPILWTDTVFPNGTNGVRDNVRVYRVIETQ